MDGRMGGHTDVQRETIIPTTIVCVCGGGGGGGGWGGVGGIKMSSMCCIYPKYSDTLIPYHFNKFICIADKRQTV